MLTLFFSASLVLLVTPGPAVIYIVTRSVAQGRRAGVVSSLALSVGNTFQVAAAAYGISMLLDSSMLAFNVVKFMGAGYLVYLGVRRLMEGGRSGGAEIMEKEGLSRIFRQGVIVNLLNPKTAVFFFSYLPQFADVSKGALRGQILFLGAVFLVMGLFVGGFYAILAGTTGNWLRRSSRYYRFQRYVTGGVFIALGVAAAFSGSGRK